MVVVLLQSLISLWEENKIKEKKEVFATQGIIPSRKPAKLSLALLNLGDAFLLLWYSDSTLDTFLRYLKR